MIELSTTRLNLRSWLPEDNAPYFKMSSDPEVMRYYPACLTREESDQHVDSIRSRMKKNGWGFWALSLKGDSDVGEKGKFIGFTGLNPVNEGIPNAPFIEVGWRIASPFWRKGFAFEAAQAVLDYAFNQLRAETIYAFTTLTNTPSRSLMEKLGMMNTQQDFNHPSLPKGHRLERHCLYRVNAD